MPPDNLPHNLLRHYVTGAIERGEAEPIVEVPALDMTEAADADPDADGYRRAASSGMPLADFECRECGALPHEPHDDDCPCGPWSPDPDSDRHPDDLPPMDPATWIIPGDGYSDGGTPYTLEELEPRRKT